MWWGDGQWKRESFYVWAKMFFCSRCSNELGVWIFIGNVGAVAAVKLLAAAGDKTFNQL